MKIKKEQPKNKARPKLPLGIKRTLLLVLMALAAKMGIQAEEKTGVVITKASSPIFSNVIVYIDTDGNGTPDHLLVYPDSFPQSPVGAFMDSLIQKGTTISFDDEKAISFSGYPSVSIQTLMSLNGIDS
jgi:hypothetical protein